MYKTLLASAIGLVLSANTMADSYQYEGTGSYVSSKTDDGEKADSAFVAGTYYFSAVNTENHPLREAAFLGKNSSASLIYGYTKSTDESTYTGEGYRYKTTDNDKNSSIGFAVDTYLFDGLLYLGGYASHFEQKNTYTSEWVNINNPSSNDKDSLKTKDTADLWRINVGIAPTEGLLIWSEFARSVHVNQSWNLNAKFVTEFSGHAVNFQGGIAQNAFAFLEAGNVYPTNLKFNFSGYDDEGLDLTSAYAIADYYFDNTLSVGVGATYYDVKDSDLDNSYMIRGQKFFSDSFSVLLQYTTNDYDDSYSIGAAIRF
jgi:hypothetical protein